MDYIGKINSLFDKLEKDNIRKLPFGENNEIFAKIENKNLTGSIKDRPALQMMLDAAKIGLKALKEKGISVGISSGAALLGALEIDKKEKGKKILVIFPDNGDRYHGII